MTSYKTKLTDYYYHYNSDNGTIYEIRVYPLNDDTECIKQLVKKNDKGVHNDTENAKIFPNVCLDLKSTSDSSPKKIYYWYQDLIKDGDILNGEKFTPHTHRGQTYMSILKDEVTKTIRDCIKNGYNASRIRRELPIWATVKVNDKVTIQNYEYTVTGITFSDNGVFTKTPYFFDNIDEFLIDALNEKIKDYANSFLSIYDKEISTLGVTVKAKG